jgi:Domain of unknown function (DUF4349)
VARLERLGEVRNRFRTAEDVTEEVVDVEARITSQRRSIDRIRALLDQAADIDDVVRIESELAARESELDSLLRRQEELAKLTALATVTVTFLGPGLTPRKRLSASCRGFAADGMRSSTQRRWLQRSWERCCHSPSWRQPWECRRGGASTAGAGSLPPHPMLNRPREPSPRLGPGHPGRSRAARRGRG